MSFSPGGRWNVDRSVQVANIFHFIYSCGKTCLVPFLSLYFKKIGMSATQVGILSASRSIIWYVTVPLWVMLAKRCDKTKCVLFYALLCSLVSSLLITLVPNIINDVSINCPPQLNGTGMKNQSLIAANITYQNPSNISSITTPAMPKLLPVAKKNTSEAPPPAVVENPVKTTNISTTITASTKPTPSVKPLTAYQIAVELVPEFIKTKPKKEAQLDEFLLKNAITKLLPEWKRKTVHEQIIKIAKKKYPSFSFSDSVESSGGGSTEQAAKKVVLKRQKVAKKKVVATVVGKSHDEPHSKASNPAVASTKTLELIADKLFAIKEKDYPYDSIDEVWNKFSSFLKSLSIKQRQVIKRLLYKKEAALDHELTDDKDYRRRRRELNISSVTHNISEAVKTSYHVFVHQASAVFDDVITRTMLNSSTFLWIYAIVLIGEFLSCSIEPLSDNSLYELLEELDCLNKYGRHKSFSQFATCLMGVLIALLVHFVPCQLSEHVYSYNLHFYGFIVFIGVALFVVPCYPVYPPRSNWKTVKALSPLSCLLCCIDCRHFIFMMTAFMTGIVQGSLNDFLFWEIDKMQHSSYYMFGIIVSANAAVQFIVQTYGKKFVPVMKVYLSGSIAIILISVQLLAISFVRNAWAAIFVQMLNVVGQTFLWTVINFHVNMRMFLSWNNNDAKNMRKRVRVFARTSHQRSMHYTLNSLHQGLAFAIGSLISGISYDIAEQSLLPFMRIMSVILIVWMMIYIFFTFMCNIKSRSFSNLLESDEEEQEQLFSFDQKREQRHKKRGYIKNKRRSKKRLQSAIDSSSDSSEREDWLETAIKEDSESRRR